MPQSLVTGFVAALAVPNQANDVPDQLSVSDAGRWIDTKSGQAASCMYIRTHVYIYGTALPAPPPLPPQWSWVNKYPPPCGCGPVVGLWWFRVGLGLV